MTSYDAKRQRRGGGRFGITLYYGAPAATDFIRRRLRHADVRRRIIGETIHHIVIIVIYTIPADTRAYMIINIITVVVYAIMIIHIRFMDSLKERTVLIEKLIK